MVQIRKEALATGQIYHIFSRSIAKYVVFNNDREFGRMFDLLNFYRFKNLRHSYSKFLELKKTTQLAIMDMLEEETDVFVEIVAFCIMPTHIHLVLKQMANNGISKYLGKILDGYSKFFNSSHKRTGPLWASRFKNVLVTKDEHLLHLTRYIHLNPCSAGIVKRPQDWLFSSYGQYIKPENKSGSICRYENLIDLSTKDYKKFVNDRKEYQRELSRIKSLLIDDYVG